jgi:integrase
MPNVERGCAEETFTSKSLFRCRVSGIGSGPVSTPLQFLVGAAANRGSCAPVFEEHREDHHGDGLRVHKELMAMRKDQVDLRYAVVRIPDSKTPNGVSGIPLTPFAVEAFRDQMSSSGLGPFLFPSELNSTGHQTTLRTVWHLTLRRAKVPHFRIYDLRATYATRLSAGGVADEWVTQLLRQGDLQAFKKYSQMKLQMKREALEKLNRQANEMPLEAGTATVQ